MLQNYGHLEELSGIWIKNMKLSEIKTNKKIHQFNPAVISAYYNSEKYKTIIEDSFIAIRRLKEWAVFLLKDELINIVNHDKKLRFYSEKKINEKSVKHIEYVYNLDELFTVTTKQIRRGMNLLQRKEIVISDITNISTIDSIINEWDAKKRSDPKVYQMLFDSKRYRRCFELKEKGFNIYQKMIFVNSKPYGIISFALDGENSFELAFVSLYWIDELKIINDLSECILINCFYDLWENYGIKYINPGTDAGIKGLKIFKSKLPNQKIEYYSFVKEK